VSDATQYPEGLYVDIYPYKIEGGKEGRHLQEINTLNHYIGMHRIDRTALSDLDWLPFALGALVLLTLRVAAIGTVRSLVDLSVVTGYVLLFSLARFAYRLYLFGHDLAPEAPVKVAPFMPAMLGTKQIANFTSTSLPQLGTLWVGLFFAGVVGAALSHLVAGRRQAELDERKTATHRPDAPPPHADADRAVPAPG